MNGLMVEGQKASSSKSSFYLENDFFHAADILRADFERLMSVSVPANSGLTPFSYAFCQDAYQFLTAGAERIFASDVLDDLISTLGTWGNRILGTSHVSTPQFRVYINGCFRNLLRDDVNAPWRFVLSLTRSHRSRKTGQINVLTDNTKSQAQQRLSTGKFITSCLPFNQMLAHRSASPYSIEAAKTLTSPLEGIVFLDGYLW